MKRFSLLLLLTIGVPIVYSNYIIDDDVTCSDLITEDNCIRPVNCGWCIYDVTNSSNGTHMSKCIQTGFCSILDRNNSCSNIIINPGCDFVITVGHMILFLALSCACMSVLFYINRVLFLTNYNIIMKTCIRIFAIGIVLTPPIILYFVKYEYFLYSFIGLFALTIMLWVLYGWSNIVLAYRNIRYRDTNQYDRVQLLDPSNSMENTHIESDNNGESRYINRDSPSNTNTLYED